MIPHLSISCITALLRRVKFIIECELYGVVTVEMWLGKIFV